MSSPVPVVVWSGDRVVRTADGAVPSVEPTGRWYPAEAGLVASGLEEALGVPVHVLMRQSDGEAWVAELVWSPAEGPLPLHPGWHLAPASVGLAAVEPVVPWQERGWRVRAEAWLDAVLGPGPTDTLRAAGPWSCVLGRAGGVFKATPPDDPAPAALIAALAAAAGPGHLPDMLARDDDHRWMVQGRLETFDTATVTAEVLVGAMTALARLQVAALDLLDDPALAALPRLDGGEADHDIVSLVHTDLHPSNLAARPDGTAVLLDWADAVVGDPFASPALFLRELRGRGLDDEAAEVLLDRYAEPWRGLVAPDQVRAHVASAALE